MAGAAARTSLLPILGLMLAACNAGASGGASSGGPASMPGVWTETTLNSEGGAWHLITCPSADQCLVAGNGVSSAFLTTDAGRSWNAIALGDLNPQDVTCVNTSTCYLVSANDGISVVAQSGDSGRHWKSIYRTRSDTLQGISCVSGSNCVVVGASTLMVTRDGGIHWAQASSPRPGGSLTVSCWNAQSCVSAIHYFYFTTQDGATNWQTHLNRGRELIKVNCPRAGSCYMIASSSDLAPNGFPSQELLLASSDGGKSWKEFPVTAAQGILDGLSCPAATTCLVSDDAGHVLSTTDGGASWQNRSIDTPGGAGPTVIACPTADLCYAGSTGGRIWVGRFGSGQRAR